MLCLGVRIGTRKLRFWDREEEDANSAWQVQEGFLEVGQETGLETRA